MTHEDRERIKEGIQQKYMKVAAGPEGSFRYPVGLAGLEKQKYDPQILKALPDEVLAFYCGVGNPFSLGPIHEGESVLDIGCGAGVDTLVVAMMVSPGGRAAGIELIPEMVERARTNLRKTSLGNVIFEQASAEDLPFPDESFDVAISNGVFNLIPDKAKALREALRVLKPHGRLMIADEVLTGEMPGDTQTMVANWAK